MNVLSSMSITSRSRLPSCVAKTATANAPAQRADGVHALQALATRMVEAVCALGERPPVSIFFIISVLPVGAPGPPLSRVPSGVSVGDGMRSVILRERGSRFPPHREPTPA